MCVRKFHMHYILNEQFWLNISRVISKRVRRELTFLVECTLAYVLSVSVTWYKNEALENCTSKASSSASKMWKYTSHRLYHTNVSPIGLYSVSINQSNKLGWKKPTVDQIFRKSATGDSINQTKTYVNLPVYCSIFENYCTAQAIKLKNNFQQCIQLFA